MCIQSAKLDLRKHIFPIRVTEPWNSLHETVASAISPVLLITQLDTFLSTQDIVYDYEAPLRISNQRIATYDLIDT